MSENAKEPSTPDKPVAVSEQQSKAATTPKRAKGKPAKAGNGRVLAIFSLLISLLLIAALGAMGWYGYQAQQQLVVLEQQAAGNDNRAKEFQQEASKLRQQLQHLNSEQQSLGQVPEQMVQQHEQMLVVLNRVDGLSRKLRELQGSNRENWLLAEAEYLMRLANQRLRTEGDVKSAETLLLDADQLLVSVDDYALFPVREAMAEDIAAVRAVPALDRDGLWLQLSALEKQIIALPVTPEVAPVHALALKDQSLENQSPENQAQTVEESSALADSNGQSRLEIWKDKIIGVLQRSWQVFSSQFRITRRDAPVEPLPTLEDEIALRLNGRLMLQQARLALLQGRQAVYSSSLEQAGEWVERYFSFDQQGSQSVLDQLNTLQQMTIEQRMPDISRGLSRLKVYLDDLSGDRRLPLQSDVQSPNNAGSVNAEDLAEPQETVGEGQK